MERNIQVSNAPELDMVKKSKINSTLQGIHDKIKKVVKNKILLRAHFKQHNTGGKRTKHTVRLHLSVPGVELSAKETDWNVLSAVQSAIETLERETMKKVKGQ